MHPTADRCDSGHEPLEIDQLLTPDERRTVTYNDQLHFRRSISVDCRGVDEIDRALDELIEADPYLDAPPSRRSDRELSRVLSILDLLEGGDA